MNQDGTIEKEKHKLELEDIERIESIEAQRRLRQAYTSSWDIARETTKLGRQGSQTNNGLDTEEEQP